MDKTAPTFERAGKLAGRVALITGGGGGIGKEAALLFAREGAKVVVADIAEDAGEAVAAAIRAEGGDALFVAIDVGEPDSVRAAVEKTVAAFGKLDTLYNNVGGTNPLDGPVDTVPIEVFWSTMRRDLFGTFLGCRFGIPEIVRAGGGAVVNTASLVALMGKPAPSQVCYTAAKGGIVSMTRAMAVQYAPLNVRVNAISPGLTLTERIEDHLQKNDSPQALIDRHLLGLPHPAGIAAGALFLASDDARYLTGHILPVDSGITMS